MGWVFALWRFGGAFVFEYLAQGADDLGQDDQGLCDGVRHGGERQGPDRLGPQIENSIAAARRRAVGPTQPLAGGDGRGSFAARPGAFSRRLSLRRSFPPPGTA